MPSGVKISRAKLRRFLASVEQDGNVTQACRDLGLSVSGIYARRQRDEEFAEQWRAAEHAFLEGVRDQVYQWAVQGWTEETEEEMPHGGTRTKTVHKFSPQFALRVLERRHPDFKPSTDVDVNLPDGVLIVPRAFKDVEAWEAEFGDSGPDSAGG